MPTPLFPITPPLAEPPPPGSGALLPTLGRGVTNVTNEREVGFTFVPEGCGESGTLPEDACDSTPSNKTIPENPDVVEAQGFYVWAGDKCSPWDLERGWRDRALRQLEATRSYQVAHELWTGDETGNRALVSETSDVVAGETNPTSVVDGIACLEHALGDCGHGRRGVIHVTLQLLTHMVSHDLVRREGNQLLTANDTIVIADAGYDGSGPYGAATADEQWAFATGRIIVRLGPTRVLPSTDEAMVEALDRATNTAEWRAEQKAAVGWDGCCHLAARVDIGLCGIGGTGS